MSILPYYFNYFDDLFPVEVIDAFSSIESSFDLINYNAHIDDINLTYEYTVNLTGSDLANITYDLYREHINSVLSTQGIFLTNPFSINLTPLVEILRGVCILATQPLTEALDGNIPEVDNDQIIYLATILNLLTNLTIEELIIHINLVTDDVITYLQQDTPLISLITKTTMRAEERFKKSNLVKEGIIVEAIKELNTFGYAVQSFIITHSEAIANLKNDTNIANEIILLVLGSSTPDNLLSATMLDIAQHIPDTANQILAINKLIMTYMDTYND